MGTRDVFDVPGFCLKSLQVLGILAMLASVPIGHEDGPMPADELVRKKHLAKMVLFTGGGLAALASIGRYAIDRPRTNDRRRVIADDRDE
jgi:hypothetical protein